MKFPVRQKTINLEGRRRKQGVGVKFEEIKKKFVGPTAMMTGF